MDLIEEVARLTGFDRFEAHLPDPLVPGALSARQQADRRLRQLISAAGLQEITTLSLVGTSEQEPERIAISNPLLAETSCLRTNLWEELLQVCVRNLKTSQPGCWVFEIGNVFGGSAEAVEQRGLLAGMICGERRLERWTSSGKPVMPTYHDARGRLAEVMQALHLELLISASRPMNDPPRPGARWCWRAGPRLLTAPSSSDGAARTTDATYLFELIGRLLMPQPAATVGSLDSRVFPRFHSANGILPLWWIVTVLPLS